MFVLLFCLTACVAPVATEKKATLDLSGSNPDKDRFKPQKTNLTLAHDTTHVQYSAATVKQLVCLSLSCCMLIKMPHISAMISPLAVKLYLNANLGLID